jgi:hypothetical protein
MKTKQNGPQEWWASLSQGERRLIRSVMGLLRGAKRSQVVEVARAAAKWERGIGCFIKVRLISAQSAERGRRNGKGNSAKMEDRRWRETSDIRAQESQRRVCITVKSEESA